MLNCPHSANIITMGVVEFPFPVSVVIALIGGNKYSYLLKRSPSIDWIITTRTLHMTYPIELLITVDRENGCTTCRRWSYEN